MSIAAGRLRESVTIQTPTEAQNSFGESEQTWTTFTLRRCSIENVSSSESIRNQETVGAVTHRVRLRYVSGLTGAMRIKWDSRSDRILEISQVLERNNREEHELLCVERVT
jgi:SPP1 family predicted phage head-tail adaptor